MSKFQAFLIEQQKSDKVSQSERSTVISEKECIRLLTTKCKSALKAYRLNNHIYRGIPVEKPYMEEDPSYLVRKSANTSNYYTWLINDILPSWKKYPKRKIICTSDVYGAEGYGDIYYVFPYDGAKIGICPKYDIWESFFASGITDMAGFNDEIELLLSLNSKRNVSFNDFEKALKEFDSKKYEIYHSTHLSTTCFWVNKYFQSNFKGTFIEYLDEILLNPSKNGFILKSIENFSISPSDHEIWLDSPVVYIHENYVIELLTKLDSLNV